MGPALHCRPPPRFVVILAMVLAQLASLLVGEPHREFLGGPGEPTDAWVDAPAGHGSRR